MNATTFLNESNLSLPFQANANSNNIDYCVLPSLHSHTTPTQAHLWAYLGANEDISNPQAHQSAGSLLSLANGQPIVSVAELVVTDLDNATSKLAASKGVNLEQQQQQTKAQHIDPYIDAVQVKNRVSNKRGARVKAAAPNGRQLTADHEPNSSYYSKTVHIEESKEANDEWDYSSGDSDDDNHHYHHKHHHRKKHMKKNKKPRKKVYVKVHEPKKKKIVYVKHKKAKKKHGYKKHHDKHDYDYHHHHHDKDNHHHFKHYHYHNEHKHHDDDYHHHHKKGHRYGKSKGKLVHLDLMGKGKMSLAGVLGYTLLCVNYLLVLKQPTYDKYSGHYYTKYTPHGGQGDTVELKSGGPVILAHCGELPEPKSLVHVGARQLLVDASQLNNVDTTNATTSVAGTPNADAIAGTVTTIASSSANQTLVTKSRLEPAEQRQAEVGHHQQLAYGNRWAAAAPPSYYYTLAPNVANQNSLLGYNQAGQSTTIGGGDQFNRGLLSPIQNALNRLFLLPNLHVDGADEDEHTDVSGVQVIAGPQVQRQARPDNIIINGQRRGLVTTVANRNQPVIGGVAGRLVIVDGQPQVVQTRDNLAEMRTRRIEIGMRVAEGRRFGLPPRTLALTNTAANGGGWPPADPNGVGLRLGVAVRAPDNMNDADQPAPNTDGDRMQNDQPPPNGNQILLDLPDYALAGDSIELTCNHRMPINRLYSVKWFKDSLEFYRFVPAEAPRMKSIFFLPDVRLDLARSGLQSIYMRNVTHRTSGLYRCEVISEAPNFEMMSGEKLMRVYSLPDTGPQLSLLERPPPTGVMAITTSGPLGTRTQLLSGGEREDDWAPGELNEQDQPEQRSPAQRLIGANGGPIIRCASDRSNPVAQLRFLINNKPVELARTLENSTLSYSDGLESNVISFRVQLSDFIFTDTGNDNGPLDKAASLKSSEDGPKSNRTMAPATTTGTTTTTTTTMKPNPAAGKTVKDKSHNKQERKRTDPNANVQFDDEHGSGAAPGRPPSKKTLDQWTTSSSSRDGKRGRPAKRPKQGDKLDGEVDGDNNKLAGQQIHSHNPAKGHHQAASADAGGDYDENNDGNTAQRTQVSLGSSLPVGQQDNALKRMLDNGQQNGLNTGNKIDENQADNYRTSDASRNGENFSSQESVKRRDTVSLIARTRHDAIHDKVANVGQTSGDNNNNLVSAEQRQQKISLQTLAKQEQVGTRTISSTGTGLRPRTGLQQTYSNFIRIKCVSSVHALGYEMTSELNVPLTLLVPASQLSDAFRQATATSTNRNRQQDDANNQQPARRSDDANNLLGLTPSRQVRNGGSLQAPRAVLIDRLAQASGPPALVYGTEDRQRRPVATNGHWSSSTIVNNHQAALFAVCLTIFSELIRYIMCHSVNFNQID